MISCIVISLHSRGLRHPRDRLRAGPYSIITMYTNNTDNSIIAVISL